MMRAPLAPMGWPNAQAPPLTLTLSCDRSNSVISAMGTMGKGFVDFPDRHRRIPAPALAGKAFAWRPGGGKTIGVFCACVAWLTMRASGLQPSFAAVDWRIATSAAAPSLMDELDAAVIVPSF